MNIDIHNVVGVAVKTRNLGLSDKGKHLGFVLELTFFDDRGERPRLTLFLPERDLLESVLRQISEAPIPSLSLTKDEQAAEAEVRA